MRALAWMVVALATAACGSTSTSVGAPEGDTGRCRITFSLPPLPAAGAQVTTQLLTTRDCVWSAVTEASWLSLDPTAGQGEATIAIAALPNPTGRLRIGPVDINGQRFSVAQEPSPCHYELSPRSANVGSTGGRVPIQVTTLEGCPWNQRSSEPWMRVLSEPDQVSESSGLMRLAVDSNPGDRRSAQLTVGGITVAITQDAGGDSAACGYSMHPGALPMFAATGGSGSATLHVAPECYWHASSDAPWVLVVSNANGQGPGVIEFRVEANPSRARRSARITAGTVQHVVNQQGAR